MRRKLFSAMLAITLLQAAPALAEARALFGAPSTESNDLTPFPKWTGVVGRYIAESATPWQGCAGGRCAGPYFKAIVAQLREQKDPVTALALVNQWFNAIPYVQDQDNWGVSDYWQNPAGVHPARRGLRRLRHFQIPCPARRRLARQRPAHRRAERPQPRRAPLHPRRHRQPAKTTYSTTR